MSWLSAVTVRCAPRLSSLLVSSPNQRSTRFSHELEVGVKCTTKRGCALSQRLIARRLVCAAVIENEMDLESGGDLAVDRGQELLELDRAVAGVQPADHLAGGEVKRRVEA